MVNIYKQFLESDKPVANLNLKLEKVVNEKTFLEKMNKLKARNAQLLKSKLDYKFRPIQIKRDGERLDFVNRPESVAVRSATASQEAQELIRIMKVYAYKYINAYRNEPELLQDKKTQFLIDYGGKMSKYNLYTKFNEIWNNFEDKNYSEPLFDKDYLGASASSQYIQSVDDRIKNEKTIRQLAESIKMTPIEELIITSRLKPFEDLDLRGQVDRISRSIEILE